MAYKYSNVGDGGCHLARDSYAPCYHQNEGHGWTFGNKEIKPFWASVSVSYPNFDTINKDKYLLAS